MTLRTTLVLASAILGLCPPVLAQETELPPAPPPTGEVAQAFSRLRPAIVRIEVQEKEVDRSGGLLAHDDAPRTLDLMAWNSASSMTPRSRRSAALASSSVGEVELCVTDWM